jgi:hypothetical protein
MAMEICRKVIFLRNINQIAILRLLNDFHAGLSGMVMPCVRICGDELPIMGKFD